MQFGIVIDGIIATEDVKAKTTRRTISIVHGTSKEPRGFTQMVISLGEENKLFVHFLKDERCSDLSIQVPLSFH